MCSTPDEQPPGTERVEDLIEHFLLTQTNGPRAEFHLAAVDKFSDEFVGAVDLCIFALWRQGTLGCASRQPCTNPGISDKVRGRLGLFALIEVHFHCSCVRDSSSRDGRGRLAEYSGALAS